MLCLVEVAMLVGGIIVMATGRIPITPTRECRGTPARIAGAVLIATLPLAVVIGLVYGFNQAVNNANPGGLRGLNIFDWRVMLIDLSVVVLCALLATAIAASTSQPKLRKRVRRDEFEDDDFDSEEVRPRAKAVAAHPNDDFEDRRDDEFDAPKKSNLPVILGLGVFVMILGLAMVGLVAYMLWPQPANQQQPPFQYVGTSTKPLAPVATSAARPPMFQPRTPRPSLNGFPNAVPIRLENGRAEIVGSLNDTDPMSYQDNRPAKPFTLKMKANTLYFLELKPGAGDNYQPMLRIESTTPGMTIGPVSKPQTDGTARLAFVPAATANYRILALLANNPSCKFILNLRETRPGDDWPDAFPAELSTFTQTSLPRVTELPGITAAAFSPDSTTIWYTTNPRTLRRYTFGPRPGSTGSIFIEMKGRTTHLAADANEQLFAATSMGSRDAIHVYDTTKLVPGKRTLEPVDTIAIDGVVASMKVVENDLIYLCGSVLTRMDTKTRKLLSESKPLLDGVRNFCVAPDGKAIWVCGDNAVQVLDPESLAIRNTITVSKTSIRFDAIQVARDGQVFLAGAEESEGFESKRVIFALQSNHTTIKQFLWADANAQFSAFTLTRDEANLIVTRFDRSPGLVETYFLTPGLVQVKNTRTSSNITNAGVPGPSRLWLSPDGQYLLCERGPVLKLPK